MHGLTWRLPPPRKAYARRHVAHARDSGNNKYRQGVAFLLVLNPRFQSLSNPYHWLTFVIASECLRLSHPIFSPKIFDT